MIFTFILVWTAVIIAVEALTELIVDSKIGFPIRDWFSRNPEPKGFWAKLRAKIGELINCGYCTSVWVAFLAAYFVPAKACTWPVFIVKALIIHRLSNMMHELFKKWLNRSPLNVVLTHIHHGGDNGRKES